MEGDGAFQDDMAADPDWKHGLLDAITFLENGTTGGRPAIGVLVKNDDGSLVIAETTWALLHTAIRAFEARYGAPE